jgi:hypothetical protein
MKTVKIISNILWYFYKLSYDRTYNVNTVDWWAIGLERHELFPLFTLYSFHRFFTNFSAYIYWHRIEAKLDNQPICTRHCRVISLCLYKNAKFAVSAQLTYSLFTKSSPNIPDIGSIFYNGRLFLSTILVCYLIETPIYHKKQQQKNTI